jgi:DNA-directed RNA polymerase specialized sigma24 family protein
MSEPDAEFANLMKRVLAGDTEAAQELHALYGHHILHAVRKRLHQRLRSKFDSIDFVQDVWASFFTDIPEKNAFATPDDLVAFLTKMARNKVSSAVRTRMHQQKYNVNRETPLETMPRGADRFPSAQQTPSEIFMEGEEW